MTSSIAAGPTEAFSFPGERPVTPEVVREHNLNDLEYGRILELLGRAPTLTELGIFSALWSEHCSYKHSKPVLGTFPTTGARVIQGPGENAGVLRLPDGWAVAFKIESHNHPSAVEPYQGAATGVGGILRDVFTMGARPVALLNSLRFGPLDQPRNRYLFAGVVRGVGDYGNCVGVPTLGGEVGFAPGYTGNPLVNAMCVGLLQEADLIRAAAHGVGNVLLCVGARTGRDGIHGASFASEELSEQSEARRPQVQVGDPFTEKLLLEASLELITTDLIVAIQDMGAAGLTSSSAEMAARGGVGVEIDTGLVPTREPGMTPYEILLSESQERMLVVAEPARVPAIQAVCARWELERHADRSRHRGRHLPGPAPGAGRRRHPGAAAGGRLPHLPSRSPGEPRGQDAPRGAHRRRTRRPTSRAALEILLDSPNLASKRWVYEQYDSTVQAATVLGPGGDAGVVRVPGTGFGLAVTVDCNNRLVALDPYEGGKAAVAEAARNIACTGARPLGHHRLPQLRQPREAGRLLPVPRGLPRHRRRLPRVRHAGHRRQRLASTTRAPPARSIRRRPSAWSACSSGSPTGCRATSPRRATRSYSRRDQRRAGRLGLLGRAVRLRRRAPPRVDLDAERRLQRLLVAAAAGGCSGRRTTAPRAACSSRWPRRRWAAPTRRGLGAALDLTGYAPGVPLEGLLYGEDGARAVVSTCARATPPRWSALAGEHGVPALRGGPGGRAPAARWNSGWGRACSAGASARCARPISRRFPGGCSIPTWTARRERKACAASSASPGFPTRPGSPTSASTPCSTGARRARASSPIDRRRAAPGRTAAWGS